MRKQITKKITAYLLLLLLVFYSFLAIAPRRDNVSVENVLLKDEDELPMLIAHRGGGDEFPENTMEAFYNAYSIDKSVVMETDVNLTRDGVLILNHDTRLDKTTNVTGLVEDWNYSDLIAQRVNFGYENDTEDMKLVGERAIFTNEEGVAVKPTDVVYPEGVTARDPEIYFATKFEELLEAFPETVMSVEIKQKGETGMCALEELIRILEKHEAFDRVIISTYNGNVYRKLKREQRNGNVPENVMYSTSLAGTVRYTLLYFLGLDFFFRDKISVFQLPMEQLNVVYAKPEFIKNMHDRNVAVQFWTIDDEEDMRTLIDLDVDGIMTDCPSKLKAVLDEYRQ